MAITDTAYYYKAVRTLADFAGQLRQGPDAERYGQLADRIRSRFNAAFLDRATGKVGTGSQSAQATALDLGLVDAGSRGRCSRSF